MKDAGSANGSKHGDVLKIVLIYAVFACLWILLSDQVLEWIFTEMTALQVAQTLKGWLFVAITSILLYFLLKKLTRQGEQHDNLILHTGMLNWSRWQYYLFAVVLTLLTLLIREGIAVSFSERPLLILFMFPIILSAAIGGLGPGLISTLVAALAESYFAIPPIGSLVIAKSTDLLQLGFMIINGLIVSFISAMLHEARYQSESEKRNAETNLAEKTRALQLLDAITEGSADAIFVKDIKGLYLQINLAAARLLGKPAQDILGKDDKALFPFDQASNLMRMDQQVIAEGHPSTFEYEVNTTSGPKYFLTTKGPMFDGNGSLFAVFGVARDITSLKMIEYALRRERDLNQRYLDSVQSIMVALDTEGRITMITRHGCEMLGYRENELLGKNWFTTCLPQPEGMDTFYPIFRRILGGDMRDTRHIENAILCQDGRQRMISWQNTSLRNEVGNVIGTLSSGEDITDRKIAEDMLRESETTYRSLFEHMLNGFAYCRMMYAKGRPNDFIYLSVNESFETQTGLKNVVGHKVSEVIPGIRESDPEIFEIYGRVASGGNPEQFETHVKALDMWFEISVYSPKRDHFVAVFDVITERKKAEISLREAESRYRSLFENNMDGVLLTVPGGAILAANSESQRIFGYSADELLNIDRTQLIDMTDTRLAEAEEQRKEQGRFRGELRLVGKHGNKFPAEVSSIIFEDDQGRELTSMIVRDITERKRTEEQLLKLSLAVEQSPENILITNIDAEIEYVNESFVRNSGYSREELIGQNPRIHHSGNTPQSIYEELWASLTQGRTWEGEFQNRRKGGSEYTVHAIISPIRQPDGRITHYVAVEEDITELKLAESEMHRLAFYDPLTNLPNRALLLERTAQALATISRVGEHSALISFNIDRFKNINDAGGQALGDTLLKAVAERLTGVLHDGDVVARIAGDEFAILLTDLAPEQQSAAHLAMHVSGRIQNSLLETFRIGNEQITLSACMGIALFPGQEDDTPLEILRRANSALHHAKTRGSGQFAFFEGTLDEIAKQRFDVERELHQAIENNELRLFLQPQVDANGRIVGAEALVRWQHPQRGLVPPIAFIPIAEESNLIIEIGVWVLTEVCRLLAREDMVSLPLRIAVNISPRHFRQSDFVDQIKLGLTSTGADPTHLTLEVTEGMLIDNINDVIAKMSELSEMGIHFSMDDFGTGYSSLSYLKRLPIHELKIDKSFIQDLTIDPEDDALVETILAVAKLMRVRVVAEGVETAEQADFLNQRGQVIHQGYLFGRPEQADTVIANITRSGN